MQQQLLQLGVLQVYNPSVSQAVLPTANAARNGINGYVKQNVNPSCVLPATLPATGPTLSKVVYMHSLTTHACLLVKTFLHPACLMKSHSHLLEQLTIAVSTSHSLCFIMCIKGRPLTWSVTHFHGEHVTW